MGGVMVGLEMCCSLFLFLCLSGHVKMTLILHTKKPSLRPNYSPKPFTCLILSHDWGLAVEHTLGGRYAQFPIGDRKATFQQGGS